MKLRLYVGLLIGGLVILGVGVIGASGAPPSGDLPWQTGIRAVGNGATIEPAVNLTDGTQTFLITPNQLAVLLRPAADPGSL